MRNLNPAASQAVDWIAELQPVQGAANPSGNLVFSSQVNGGGYTPQIVFLSGGGIGVGTATPNYFMQLSSPAGVNALLQITNGSVGTEATHGAYFGQISGQTLFRIYQLENDDILFATNNAEAMRIKNTGHLTLTAASAPGTPHVADNDRWINQRRWGINDRKHSDNQLRASFRQHLYQRATLRRHCRRLDRDGGECDAGRREYHVQLCKLDQRENSLSLRRSERRNLKGFKNV